MRKWVPVLILAAGLLGLGAATFPESHVRAAVPEDWEVFVDGHTQAGATAAIFGMGFDPAECTSVRFGWAPASDEVSAEPDVEGFVHASIQIPDRPAGETVTLQSECWLGESTTPGPSTPVVIEQAPTITLSLAKGRPGSKVTLSGTRFYCQDSGEGGGGGMAGPSATGPAELYWAIRPAVRTHVPVAMNATFTLLATVPPLPVGPQQLVIECQYAGGGGTAMFTVTASPVEGAPGPGPVAAPAGGPAPVVPGPPVDDPAVPPVALPPPPVTTAPPPVTTATPAEPPAPGPDSGTAAEPTLSAGGDGVPPIRRSALVPTAFDLPGSAVEWILTALIAALLILLIAFPAELFNKTYERNEVEIHGAARRLGLPDLKLKPAAGFALFTVFSVSLTLLFAAGEGAEGRPGNPIAQLVGLAVAIPLVMLVYAVPAELYLRRRSRLVAVLRVLPTALLIAIACGALSALLKLNPPYLYGLFAGFAVAAGVNRDRRERHEGPAVLRGVVSLAALGVAAWLLWTPFHRAAVGPDAGWSAVILDSVLFWILALSAEALLFALFPLKFLDGARLRGWRFTAWLYPQVAAALFFTLVLIKRGDVNHPGSDMVAVFRALAFFLIFGTASVLFWGYFRWSKRPTRRYAEPARSRRRVGS